MYIYGILFPRRDIDFIWRGERNGWFQWYPPVHQRLRRRVAVTVSQPQRVLNKRQMRLKDPTSHCHSTRSLLREWLSERYTDDNLIDSVSAGLHWFPAFHVDVFTGLLLRCGRLLWAVHLCCWSVGHCGAHHWGTDSVICCYFSFFFYIIFFFNMKKSWILSIHVMFNTRVFLLPGVEIVSVYSSLVNVYHNSAICGSKRALHLVSLFSLQHVVSCMITVLTVSPVFPRSSLPWCSPCVCSEGSSRAADRIRELFISKREIRRKETGKKTWTLVNLLFFFYIVLIG